MAYGGWEQQMMTMRRSEMWRAKEIMPTVDQSIVFDERRAVRVMLGLAYWLTLDPHADSTLDTGEETENVLMIPLGTQCARPISSVTLVEADSHSPSSSWGNERSQTWFVWLLSSSSSSSSSFWKSISTFTHDILTSMSNRISSSSSSSSLSPSSFPSRTCRCERKS